MTGEPRLGTVLLVVPENGYYAGFHGLAQTEPLGIEFVAGAITDLVDQVLIHDDRVCPGEWREVIRRTPPDLIGVSCQYTADVPAVRALVTKLHEETGGDVPIVVGGHHIGLRPADLFVPEVTAIVCGPGEQPFRDIVVALAGKRSLRQVKDVVYRDRQGQFISNVGAMVISPSVRYESAAMDARPYPRRDLVAQYRSHYHLHYYPGVYSIEMARGCRFRCTFCSVWQHHHGTFEVEPVDRTIAELAAQPPGYTVMVDDLAFSNVDDTMRLADAMISNGLKKRYWAQVRADNVSPKDPKFRKAHHKMFERLAQAGLDMVLIGLESFDPAELKRVNKGLAPARNIEALKVLKDLDIKLMGAQIVFPDWDIADFDRTIELNQRLGVEVPQFTILTPLPGTPDYQKAVESGKMLTQEPAYFDFYHSVLPTKLPLPEFYRQISRLYRETGWWATSTPSSGVGAGTSTGLSARSGITANSETAKRGTRMMLRDLREGWTTLPAVQKYAKKMEVLRDETVHLKRLEQSDLHRVHAPNA
jgi:hopanoid C-3 methylase